MKHSLDSGNFKLEWELQIFENDISFPINTILAVTVLSDGFSAQTTMDISIKDFSVFTCNLKQLYDTLQGSARLEEPYGMHNHIEFLCTENGYIAVNGILNNYVKNGLEQELHFENEFDQTYLKDFVNELYLTYEKYR